MKKLYYLVGTGVTLAAGFVVGIPAAVVAGVCVAAAPFAINRPEHLILNSRRTGALLRDVPMEEFPDAGLVPVKALTFNIFMRPSLWFVKNVKDDYKNERLELFIRDHLASYGVICLQEMFGTLTWRQRRLLSAAEECGFQHAAVGGASPFVVADHHLSIKIPFLDSGVLTLCKYPIKETDTLHYSSSVLIDSYAPKIVLWSLVKLPQHARYFHVFNTHMQSTHTGWSAEQTVRARAHQVEEMAFFVRKKMSLHPGAPALICGDFNLDARGQYLEYVRMLEILKHELADLMMERGWTLRNLFNGEFPITYGMQGERTLTMEKDWDREMCLDYTLFVGAPDAPHTAQLAPFHVEEAEGDMPARVLSDHQGIECTILL
jgi:endonuclease/exonuclease/phosphatase family metal-dependent hydrolase